MKRSLRTMIGLAAMAALPTLASAQTARPIALGVSGGLSLPMGDLGEGVSSGFTVAGHITFRPATFTNLSFRGDVSFDRWSTKDGGSALGDGNIRALGVTGNLVYAFPQANPSMVRPYVLGGVGFFNSKGSYEAAGISVESESSTDLGIQAGAGLNFNLSGFSTFLEAKYVNVFGDGSSANWIPITFGIRF
jgi:opacity protein-like surface antigen